MYASNEDEDWIYLHKTPPINTVLQKAVDYECSSSSESYSSISLSSTSSNEFDVSLSSINNSIESYDLEQVNNLLSEQLIETSTDTPATTNENDVLNKGFELSDTFSLTNDLRHRTSVNVQEKYSYNSEVIQSTAKQYQNKNDRLVSCTCLIVLLTVSFIFGQIFTQWDQPRLNKIAIELIKTNQRLNKINDIPLENFQEKLTKQLEDKIQNIINQQLTWYEHEKSIFISQIHELREVLHKTQENLTNNIHQLTNENEQLHEQIKSLEHRLEVAEENKGINCTKSSKLTLDKFVTNIFKQTISIATDTSINLSGFFEHLSASVSNIVDHHHQSKQKLTNLAGEKVQISFRKGKSTYATWIKSRAQIRMNNNKKFQQQIRKKFPWRNQISTKENICYTKFYFPINKICSMVKFFRP